MDRSFPHRATRGDRTDTCFAVADGVGGMDLGEVASSNRDLNPYGGVRKCAVGTMLISLVPRLIQHANAAVHDRRLEPKYRGKNMATTLARLRAAL